MQKKETLLRADSKFPFKAKSLVFYMTTLKL